MLSADKKKKIGLFVFSVLFIVVGLLAGCGPQGQEGTWEETEAAQELIIGVGRNFYYGPESCQFVHGSTGVWESLTYLSKNLEPLPLLAEDLIPDVEKRCGLFTFGEASNFTMAHLLMLMQWWRMSCV